jgi:hypothetical protein
MLESEARDARRTARHLERLMDAADGRATDVPVGIDLDPSVRLAARQLRAGLLRVHPSFRFEENLAGRLATVAARLQDGAALDLEVDLPATPAPIVTLWPDHSDLVPSASAPVAMEPEDGQPTRAAASALLRQTIFGRLLKKPSLASRPSRPLIVGGVGVASAAISLGAIYFAWRLSHPSPGPMVRAVRAAHANRDHGRRSNVLGEILGVVS